MPIHPDYRSTLAIAALAALALAGCGKKDTVTAKNESVESVAGKLATSDLKPRAGLWDSQMKLERMEVGNLPPAAKAAMDKQRGMIQTFSSCLTPEQAARPTADFFDKGASGCTYDHFTMAGGTIDAEMTCKQGGVGQHVRMHGTYSPDNYTMSIASEGEMQPGSPMKTEMTITSRRVGECTGKEGS